MLAPNISAFLALRAMEGLMVIRQISTNSSKFARIYRWHCVQMRLASRL